MLLLRYLMFPDGDGGALGGSSDNGDSGSDNDDSGESDSKGEGTTPEEVRETLKNSGINLPPEPEAGDDDADDTEEGEDPDKPEAGADEGEDEGEKVPGSPAEGKETQEVGNEEPVEPDDKPEDSKPAEDDSATDEKYSFTVKDSEGKTYKIKAGDDIDEVLEDFDPKSTGQLITIMRQLDKIEAEKAADEANAAEEQAETERQESISKIREGWNSEVTDLTAQKRLPEGEDGAKRVSAVYKFMGEENARRGEKGKPPLQTFEDALDKLEIQENRKAEADKAKAAKDEARKNGNLVGGSSAPASSGAKVYRAGSARNSQEAIRQLGLA